MDLSGLNPSQREVVESVDGQVMVLAGAGSGKTRTLVSRITYLLNEKGISTHQLIAVTFSNKAAKEMRDRIASEVQEDIGSLQVTTFHSFCANVLRHESNYLGLSRNFTIYDDSESKAMVKSILGRRGISQKELPPSEILYYIAELKNLGHYLGEENLEVDKNDEYYSFFEEYERELHKANAVDFGGLITGVLQLFDYHPQVLERYQDRFRYVLVDEYQDTNRCQFKLIVKLSDKHKNICVVGDEDQSIYSWRGADIRNILDFEKYFKEAKLIKLEQNYRSSKNIINAAASVIERNVQRKGKEIWTSNDAGDSISIFECSDDLKEADLIGDEVAGLRKNGVPGYDIACFYRSNSQSRVLEDVLRKKNIPYRIVGGVRFYERKEVKDLLAYVRLIVNEKDSLALSRVINTPTRGIGATSLRKIEEEAMRQDTSLWSVIKSIVDDYEGHKHLRLMAKVRSSLGSFVSLIDECRYMEKEKADPHSIFEKLLYESGYFESLRSSKTFENMARIDNLEELGNAICQYAEEVKKPTLEGFLESVTLDTTGKINEEGDESEVSLMTIHGAKGLEFPYVFVLGNEENLFPSFQSIDRGEMAIEEERRLFYVAMTRAMKKLHLSFAQKRMMYGSFRFNGPSRFLLEIPPKYYSWDKMYDAGYSSSEFEDDFNQDVYQAEETYHVQYNEPAVSSGKYHRGDCVIHTIYGQGVVTESSGLGKDEKVVIEFSDGTKKKFMVEYAPISPIEG